MRQCRHVSENAQVYQHFLSSKDYFGHTLNDHEHYPGFDRLAACSSSIDSLVVVFESLKKRFKLFKSVVMLNDKSKTAVSLKIEFRKRLFFC